MARKKRVNTGGVAVYARYSTDRQNETSIEDQVRRVTQKAVDAGKFIFRSYTDAAISGSHVDRTGLIEMLEDAKQGLFNEVWVDDLSRLSREMGATWKLIFEDFVALGVKAYDCSTGMGSTDQGARLMYGVKALINEQYIETVRYQTHRGLEGRALAGFWTGGRVFGYTTIVEPNPSDPRSPRKIPAFEPKEVLLLKEMAAKLLDGWTTRKIAAWLNDTGVPAPHDGGLGNKHAKGWGHTTVRSMFLNRRYMGEWAWNTCKWEKIPGKKQRRRVPRPRTEWVIKQVPDLAIFDIDTWNRIQARFRTAPTEREGGPVGARGPYRSNASMFAGLLKCHTCGGSMNVASRKTKGNVTYTMLACGIHRSRGSSICSNDRYIGDNKVKRALEISLENFLAFPGAVERVVRGVERIWKELETSKGHIKELDTKIHEQKRKIANLLDAFATSGASPALRERLRAEEEVLLKLEAELGALRLERPIAIPGPEQVRRHIRNILVLMETSPEMAKAGLKDLFGSFVLEPYQDDKGGGYILHGAFDIRVMIPGNSYAPESERPDPPVPGRWDPFTVEGYGTVLSPDGGVGASGQGLQITEEQNRLSQPCDGLTQATLKSSGGALRLKVAQHKVGLRVRMPQGMQVHENTPAEIASPAHE